MFYSSCNNLRGGGGDDSPLCGTCPWVGPGGPAGTDRVGSSDRVQDAASVTDARFWLCQTQTRGRSLPRTWSQGRGRGAGWTPGCLFSSCLWTACRSRPRAGPRPSPHPLHVTWPSDPEGCPGTRDRGGSLEPDSWWEELGPSSPCPPSF